MGALVGCTGPVYGRTGFLLPTELVGTWWYWVSVGRHWLAYGGTGSVWSGTGWYLVVLVQYGAVLVDT